MVKFIYIKPLYCQKLPWRDRTNKIYRDNRRAAGLATPAIINKVELGAQTPFGVGGSTKFTALGLARGAGKMYNVSGEQAQHMLRASADKPAGGAPKRAGSRPAVRQKSTKKCTSLLYVVCVDSASPCSSTILNLFLSRWRRKTLGIWILPMATVVTAEFR